jgi:hypothetical protein
MRAVFLVAGWRLSGRVWAWVAGGVLLGLGFGLCLASFTAARRTVSAYDRILATADAPDAAVNHNLPPDKAAALLAGFDEVTRQRYFAGFIGTAAGIDPALTRVMLAPAEDAFPIDRPTMRGGRLPNPDAANEVFVSTTFADRAHLELGQTLDFNILAPNFFSASEPARCGS